MAEFHFLRPYWLLAIVPTLLIWYRFVRQQDQVGQWGKDIDPHLLRHLLVGEEKKNRFRPVHVLLAGLLVAGFAMAGPAYKKEPSPFLDDEAGLMILLKVSRTMEATDVQPSRLTRAKHKIRDLMELREGSATGLIVYSGSAHLVMPLTRDQSIITTMLEDLGPELMPVDGDNLAAAMELSTRLLQSSMQQGSVLVIADAVSPSQIPPMEKQATHLPLQFLSMLPPSAAVDSGMESAAKALGAPLVKLTVDPADMERIAGSAKRDLSSVMGTDQNVRYADSGYLLLPFIGLCILLWFRKGWVLQ